MSKLVELTKYRFTFLGKCMGVGLSDRDRNDKHQMISILVEDDGNWFESACFSSYWLEELIQQLQNAQQFLNTRAKKYRWGLPPMTDTYRIVLHVDIDAEDASHAYEKAFDAMMATGLPWETTDEWYINDAAQPMAVEDVNAARDAFSDRRSDPMLASDLRARIYQRRLKEDAQLTALLDGFQKLFKQAPQVLAVRWEQYTPYFNSGDPCEFRVHPPTFQLAGRDGYHEYFGWREPRSDEEREINAALKPIIPVQLFSFDYREAFQSTFGDHVVVTMHRDLDVVIEDCVHD